MTSSSPPIAAPDGTCLPDEVRVLHVDDDGPFLDVAREFLERADDRLSVTTVSDPHDVLPTVREGRFHCVLSDYDMPRLDGLALFEELREAGLEVPFVLFTGKGSESIVAEAMSVGVTDYIQKGGTDTYEVVANRILDAVRSRHRKAAVDHAVDQYTELIETAHLPVYLYDETGEVVYANEAAADLFGVATADDVIGLDFESVVPPESHDVLAARLSRVAAGEQVPQTEFQVEAKDGVNRLAAVTCAPAPHHEGAVGQTIAHDVTERETTRRELETVHEVVTAALEASDAGIWVHDTDTGAVARHAVAPLVGAEADELGDDIDAFLEYLHPDDRPKVAHAYSKAVGDGESFRVEFRTDPDAGEPRYLEDRGTVLAPDGDPERIVGMMIDVTERRRRERQIASRRERLATVAETLSHDMGNALDTLEGQATLAREADDPTERLADLTATVERVREMVDELGDTARPGDPFDDTEPVALDEAATTACRASPLSESDLRVASDAVVEADPRAVRRLFENLFDNAVKYAGPDPTVSVGDLPDGFYVEDDGGGLPDGVTDPFAVGVTTDDDSGGVGLASVAQVARGHGWRVTVADEGEGARFEVRGVDPASAERVAPN